LNLSNDNSEFQKALLKLEDYNGEIDRYYLEHIHPKFNAYMCDPMIAIQKEGYSDIEGKEVNYDFMQQTLQGLRVPESGVDEEGNYVLKLPEIRDEDLPKVSIITPTYNRRKIFDMALRNFENFNYPKNKLEWVIVDDSIETDEIDESVRDMLPRDKRIKYVRLNSNIEDGPMTIAMKRNIGVSNSSNPYIVHMDDDDYYPPESIIARIKILMKYEEEGIECVGSTLIGTYNLVHNISSMSSDGPISLSEASMAYTKKFWESRPFDESCKRGEHKYFTEQRLHKIIDMPYSFILIAVNHRSNYTAEFRSDNGGILKYSKDSGKEGEYANFFDTWDLDTQIFIMDLRKYLIK
jgi:glycosyltransferase involved in cell wall biosynthesis